MARVAQAAAVARATSATIVHDYIRSIVLGCRSFLLEIAPLSTPIGTMATTASHSWWQLENDGARVRRRRRLGGGIGGGEGGQADESARSVTQAIEAMAEVSCRLACNPWQTGRL
jgi:hypothetical protein